jgi:hypothetical protein
MSSVDPALLHQRWVHSHEEDTDTEMVFRPATFAFPRSRGRLGLDLAEDGTLVEQGIAPTDGPQESRGSWGLEGENGLVLREVTGRVKQRWEIASVSSVRLVLRK